MNVAARGRSFTSSFAIEESEDGRRSAHGLLEAVVEKGKPAHRIVELEEQEDECAENAHASCGRA